MLLRVTLFLQNNPSGLLAKTLWVLPPHNPSCATACNSEWKQNKVSSIVLNVPVLRITACKGMILQNRTAHVCCTIFLNKDYVWHFPRVGHFDNKHVLFHNTYCENSFSLHGLVARHAFSLHRTFSGGSFFSQMMHFIARVSSQSKNLPAAML